MTTTNLSVHETLTQLFEELDERFACQSSKVDGRRQITCLSPDGGTRFTWISAAQDSASPTRRPRAYVRVENCRRNHIPIFNFAVDFDHRRMTAKSYGFDPQTVYEYLAGEHQELTAESQTVERGLVELALLGNGTMLLAEASVQHQPLCSLLAHASSALLATVVRQRETMAAYRDQNIVTACQHQKQLEAVLPEPNPDTQSVNT